MFDNFVPVQHTLPRHNVVTAVLRMIHLPCNMWLVVVLWWAVIVDGCGEEGLTVCLELQLVIEYLQIHLYRFT